jgi:hypothetical protein
MTNYNYLIIGGGMTAAAAVDGIREVDSTGGIRLISGELDAPYDRPPLSKALWKAKPLDIIWRKTENKEVKLHLGRVVKEIVPGDSCHQKRRRRRPALATTPIQDKTYTKKHLDEKRIQSWGSCGVELGGGPRPRNYQEEGHLCGQV